MNKLLIVFISLLIQPITLMAQSTGSEVQTVIETLFDGMREADSAKVASTFASDAIMQTIAVNQEGEVIKMEGSLSRFLETIATPREDILDERILSYSIKIDGSMASVWTPYEFYVGDNFSHCGVNSFQLAELDGDWKVIYIVDTRRRSGCGN